MKTYARAAGILCVAAVFAAAADETSARRVLVLRNEDTLTGYITLRDGQYHLQGPNSETVVPASGVLKVCDTPEEAHEYLCNRANLKDPDERMRLARWCQRNGLTARAKEQAEAVLSLRSGDAEAQRLLRAIAAQQSIPAAPPPAPARTTSTTPTSRAPSSQEQDYKQETLVEYTRQIQPILMNGCGLGACHGNNQRNGYELYRAPVGSQLNALQTRQNLTRTLELVNRDDVEQSPLLRKALQPHGGSVKPPLGGSDSPPFRNLSAWVSKLSAPKAVEAASASPRGAETTPAGSSDESTGFAGERDDQSSRSRPKTEPRPKGETAPSAGGARSSGFAAGDGDLKSEPGKAPVSGDPFDPEVFNQQFHRKK